MLDYRKLAMIGFSAAALSACAGGGSIVSPNSCERGSQGQTVDVYDVRTGQPLIVSAFGQMQAARMVVPYDPYCPVPVYGNSSQLDIYNQRVERARQFLYNEGRARDSFGPNATTARNRQPIPFPVGPAPAQLPSRGTREYEIPGLPGLRGFWRLDNQPLPKPFVGS